MNGKLICVCSLLVVLFLDSTSGAALGLAGIDVAELGVGSDSGSSTSAVEATQQETQAKPESESVDLDKTVDSIEPAKITVIEVNPQTPATVPEVPPPAPAPVPEVPAPVPEVPAPAPAPEVPVPEVPAPAPEVPAPEVPVPEVPVPAGGPVEPARAPEAPEEAELVTEAEVVTPAPFVCPNIEETLFPYYEGLYPDTEDCSKFYHCTHGQAMHKNCSPTTVFDPALNVCNFPSEENTKDCKYLA